MVVPLRSGIRHLCVAMERHLCRSQRLVYKYKRIFRRLRVLRHVHSYQSTSWIFLQNKKEPQRITPNRLIINGFLTICLNLLIAVLYETFIAEFIYKPETDDFWGSLYIFCIVASFVAEFHVLREYTDIVIKQKEENLLLTKRLLKSQMDPHFVFNCLNILSGLIEEDSERAERFIISLSRIYRYIINSLDKDIVPISEAMAFAKEYVSIMQTRYPSSIDFGSGGKPCV